MIRLTKEEWEFVETQCKYCGCWDNDEGCEYSTAASPEPVGDCLVRKAERKPDALIKDAIDDLCDSECPHCNRPLNLPSDGDIENWLEGDK